MKKFLFKFVKECKQIISGTDFKANKKKKTLIKNINKLRYLKLKTKTKHTKLHCKIIRF